MKRVVLTKIVSTIGSALYVHLNRASDTHAHRSKFGKSRVSGGASPGRLVLTMVLTIFVSTTDGADDFRQHHLAGRNFREGMMAL